MMLKFLIYFLLPLSQNDSSQSAFYLKQYPDYVIEKCNTAKHCKELSNTEKEVILFTNLVRYNPPLFLQTVAKPYIENVYLKHFENNQSKFHIESLFDELSKTAPMPVLQTETVLNETAAEHASYCSRTGHIGHDNFRQRWEKIKNKLGHIKAGENCSYVPSRFNNALLHVISLLIDEDSPLYHGHREAILYKSYQYIGVAIQPFPQNQYVLVQHFSLKKYLSN